MISKNKSQIEREKLVLELLSKVFLEGGYSQIELNKLLKDVRPQDKPYITRLFYGCIEKSIQFDRIIDDLTQKQPQKLVVIVLKIGLYLLRYTDTPDYAAIDKTVSLIKSTKKSALSGFVNSVLKRSVSYTLPNELYVELSCPKWLIDLLKKRYDEPFIRSILAKPSNKLMHIRANLNSISKPQFEHKLIDFSPSPCGYFVANEHLKRLNPNEYIIQSLSSMIAVKAYLSGEEFKSVLDLCGAPGGKSVYLKQLLPLSEVLCCDNQPHRVELIKKYAKKYSSDIKWVLNDATLPNLDFVNKFDLVICDVPCSGFGIKSKPDIFLNRKKEDIQSLNKLQLEILSVAKSYVKSGGVLSYSTCTILKEENEDIINRFLSQNPNFNLETIKSESIQSNGMYNIHPQEFGSDGFFICRMRRS